MDRSPDSGHGTQRVSARSSFLFLFPDTVSTLRARRSRRGPRPRRAVRCPVRAAVAVCGVRAAAGAARLDPRSLKKEIQ